jgi:2-amino-4-hydroxy-6-hydroxymethyldihydropteridine diphosphokinase
MAASLRISEAPAEGWLYLIALGSNQRHHHYGAPRAVLAAAVSALRGAGLTVLGVAPVIDSAPVGPSLRRYANGAVLVRSVLEPVALLGLLQGIEAAFGAGGRGAGDRGCWIWISCCGKAARGARVERGAGG